MFMGIKKVLDFGFTCVFVLVFLQKECRIDNLCP